MSERSPETFDVGYHKPPKEHQFQPGKSGNPNGRPKTHYGESGPSIALFKAFKKTLDRTVPVGSDGKRKKMPLGDYVVEKFVKTAVKDARLLPILLKFIERADRADFDGQAGEPTIIHIIGGLPDRED